MLVFPDARLRAGPRCERRALHTPMHTDAAHHGHNRARHLAIKLLIAHGVPDLPHDRLLVGRVRSLAVLNARWAPSLRHHAFVERRSSHDDLLPGLQRLANLTHAPDSPQRDKLPIQRDQEARDALHDDVELIHLTSVMSPKELVLTTAAGVVQRPRATPAPLAHVIVDSA